MTCCYGSGHHTPSASFVGEPAIQVVVPTPYRSVVLKAAHDGINGHPGVNKTYDRVLKNFYWPGLKDVSSYVRTCDTCQRIDKPNQVLKPAPLRPISTNNKPFEYLIIDCVGPLPPSKTGYTYLLTYVPCYALSCSLSVALHNYKINRESTDTVYVRIWRSKDYPV